MASSKQLDIFSLGEVETPKARSQQDITLSGQWSTINTRRRCSGIDTPKPGLSKTTSPACQMSLLENSQPQMSLSAVVLAQISPGLVVEPVLQAIAVNCFLSTSDSSVSSNPSISFLRMSKDCSPVTAATTSRKCFAVLPTWGMWGLGNSETPVSTSPKTEKGSSVWVCYGKIQSNSQSPSKQPLSEVIGANSCVVYRAAGGDREYWANAPTLRSLSNTGGHQSGSGAVKVRTYTEGTSTQRPMTAEECEVIMGWEPGSTAIGIDDQGNQIQISQTQRKKILGNGIVPQEITSILSSLP